MSERDPLPALRGLIDEPIAPRSAFADELRARLMTELGAHRPAAIDEERTMEITTPGLQLVLPGERARQMPSWRRLAEIAALIVLVFGVIAVFASERVGSPANPPPTSQGNLGVYPQSFATPAPGTVTENEANVGVLWKVPTYGMNSPLIEVKVYGEVAYFLDQFGIVSAVDVASGDLLWKADADIGWGISVDDSGVYVTARINEPDTETRLIKFDLATGKEDWHVSLGPDVASQPILKDGVAYIWDGQNFLYAVETATGREVLRRHSIDTPEDSVDLSSLDQQGFYRPDALLEGDNLFVITSDGQLGRIALGDAKSGEWEWKTQLENSGARQYFMAATSDTIAAVSIPIGEIKMQAGQQTPIADRGVGTLVVFDGASGDELWRTDAEDAPGPLVANGDRYIVSIEPGSIPSTPIAGNIETSFYESRSYDARTGDVQWTVPFFAPWAITPDGSTVVSFTGDGFITVVDTATGQVLGSAYTFGTIYGGFTVTDDALFGYRSDDVLIAVDLDALKNGRLQGGETPQNTPTPDSALLWQSKPEGEVRDVGKEAISNGIVFRMIATSDFQGVEAFDTTNGALLWRQAVVGDDLVADENGVYVTTETYLHSEMSIPTSPEATILGPTDTSVIALDPTSGEELWTTDTGTGEAYPTLRDGTLYVLESDWDFNVPRGMTQEITAIDTSDGSIVWTKTVGVPIGTSVPAVSTAIEPNRLVVGEVNLVAVLGNGSLVGVDRATGDTLWEHRGFDPTNVYADLAIDDSTVVVSTYPRSKSGLTVDGFPELNARSAVLAYNVNDGTPLWAYDTGGVVSNVTIADGFAVVLAGPSAVLPPSSQATPEGAGTEIDWVLIGIDIKTGTYGWQGMSGGGGFDRPPYSVAQSPGSDTIYMISSTMKDTLFVVDPTTGLMATGGLNFEQPLAGVPVNDGSHIFIQLEDGTLVATVLPVPVSTNPGEPTTEASPSPEADSALLWQAKPEGDVRWAGPEVVSNGTVFRLLTTRDFQGVEAYDTVTGSLLWRHAVQGTELVADDSGVYVTLGRYANPEMSITVSATPDYFVIGPNDASVIKLDPENGEELWSVNTGTGESSPVLIDGTLYLLESTDAWNVARGMTQEATAIDSSTGSILWSETVGVPMGQGLAGGYARMVATNSNLVALLGSGLMVGIDRSNGAVLWERVRFDPLNLGLSIDSSGDTVVVSVHAATTSLNYWLPEFPELQSGSAVIAYNASDGTPLWAYDIGGVDSNVTIADGFVVVLAGPSAVPGQSLEATPEGAVELDWQLIGIDLSTGKLEWKGMSGFGGPYPSPYYVAQSPGSETIYVLSRTMKNTFDVVDPVTGLTATGGGSFGQPIAGVPVNDGSHVFIQLQDGTLIATLLPVPQATEPGTYVAVEPVYLPMASPEAEATPDAIAWRIDGVDSVVDGGDITVTGNTLLRAITTEAGGQIDAFDTVTGDPIWSKQVWWTGGIVLGDGLIYLPVIADNGITGSIVAIEPTTGETVWEQPVGGRPIMPSLLGSTLFAAADSGLMTALDSRTGEVLWANHASFEPANGYAAGPLPMAVIVSPKYVAALYPTGDRQNLGVLTVFDATDGKQLYQLTDYPYTSTQYVVIDDTLVILTPPRVDDASPTTNPNAPMELRGIDLANGNIIWDNEVVTRFDEPIVTVNSSDGIVIQLIAEQIETETGLYNENGFSPDGTISLQPDAEYVVGAAFQVDPATGEATYVSISHLYPYKFTGPLGQPGMIAIDYSQPPVGIDQPLLVTPIGDQQNMYLLLADGSVVAVKQEAIRGG